MINTSKIFERFIPETRYWLPVEADFIRVGDSSRRQLEGAVRVFILNP